MDTQNFYDLKIEDADDGTVLAANGGAVSTNGESASVYVWDHARGKSKQIDRLTSAQIKRAGKDTTILTGTSQDLVRTVGLDKEAALKTLRLSHGYPLERGKVIV